MSQPADWADYFARDPEAQVTMSMAQRMGLTFPEMLERLDLSVNKLALDAEQGWRIFDSLRSSRRCPGCGVDPDDMDDENGRSADEPLWKIVRCECAICFERFLAMHAESGDKEDESFDRQKLTAGVYYRVDLRGEGEPVSPRMADPRSE